VGAKRSKQSLAELPQHVASPNPSIYWSNNYVVLDFETTTVLKGSPVSEDNNIVLACWTTGEGKTKSKRGNEYEQAELLKDIEAADFIVAHNTKFELGWLRRCGIDLHKVVTFDTMIADYVLGGNRYSLHQLSLSACLKRHGFDSKMDVISMMIKLGVPVPDISESWLLKYCLRDVEAAHELFLVQRHLLKESELEAINYQRNLVTPALADLEFNGMQLDVDAVLKMEKEGEENYARLTAEMQEFCEGASPASPKQMQEFIYGTLGFSIPKDFRGNPILTPTGAPSVASPVMEKLRATSSKQRDFIDLRSRWATAHSDLTKYLRKFAECCRTNGGLLHGSFNQCSTRTHRLSSSGQEYKVQFQNFNRHFKPLFTARNPLWLMAEGDGAQLEFRVATHMGRDKVALQDIVEGADIHRYTASIINSVEQCAVTKQQRTDAKPHTFKPLYGGGSGTPNERAYYQAFKDKYWQVADTQTRWTQDVLRDKFLVTEWGMKYYWPDTRMTKSGWITNTTSIFNYPVQALATAEIIPCALVCAWHRIKNLATFLVNTVHDSIIAEVHPEEVDVWHAAAKQCLIHDSYKLIEQLYGVKLTVPLGAGVQVGTHWANAEAAASEVVYEAPEELWKPEAIKEGMI